MTQRRRQRTLSLQMTSAGLPDILKGWSTIQEELGRSQAEACRDIMKFRKNEVDPCPRETKACGDGGWVWWRWGASQGRASGPCVQQAELGKDPGSLDYPMNTWTYLMVLFLHGCVFSSAFCVYICGYLHTFHTSIPDFHEEICLWKAFLILQQLD